MRRVSTITGAATALILLAALSACSPAAEKAETAAPAETAAAPVEAAPAAPPAEATPAAPPVTLAVKDAAGATLSGDVASGERVFRQCASCHVITAGVNRVGPSLHAIIGRAAGTVEGFKYSDANKNSGVTWTEQELYTYLENPRAKIPGTTMAFVGLRDSQQRADVIAFLKEKAK